MAAATLSTAGRDAALATGIPAVGLRLSLHTGDPGATGANEVTGGSPAYARQAVAWSDSGDGVVDNDAEAVFDVPTGTTITHVGVWTTGGTFLVGWALDASQAFSSQGTYTIAAAGITLTQPAS